MYKRLLGLRLADKRSLPCPKRNEWIAARDELYEEIMLRAWNPELKCFGQSYEETSILDSSILIMPLVFFIQPVSLTSEHSNAAAVLNDFKSDPRFVSTLKQILKTPDRGGLTTNVMQLVFHCTPLFEVFHRISYIATMSTNRMMGLEERKEPFACALCGV